MNTDRYNWHRRPASGILTPDRFAEGQELCISLGNSFGRFALEKRNRYGSVTGSMAFDNLITDAGLDFYGSQTSAGRVTVGTGTNPASPLDVALQTPVATAAQDMGNISQTAAASAAVPALETKGYTFPVGAINANLTEIGLAQSGSPFKLGARALIVDGSGSPVAFPVASDEQLSVSYTRGIYTLPAPVVTTQLISGTSYGLTIYPLSAGTLNYSLLYAAFDFNGASIDTSSAVPPWGYVPGIASGSFNKGSYANGNFYRDVTGTWPVGTGTGNIRRVFLQGAALMFGLLYDTALVKTSGMTLTLPYRISWGRA